MQVCVCVWEAKSFRNKICFDSIKRVTHKWQHVDKVLMCNALNVEKAFDLWPRHMILKVRSEPNFLQVSFSFQQRFRERLLNDSAPQRCCQAGEHSPRG